MSSANNLVSALSCCKKHCCFSDCMECCNQWMSLICNTNLISTPSCAGTSVWSAWPNHHWIRTFFLSRSKFFSLLCMMEQIEVVLKWYKEMSSSVSVCQGKSCMEKWSSHRWLKLFSSFISSSIQVLRIYWTSFKHWMQPTSWKWSLQSGKVSDGHVAS